MSTTLIIIIVAVLIVLYAISLYNRLIRLRNNRENAYADIDVQLKQRHDLIPQLVEAVRGYMKHENQTLVDLTKARTAAMAATTIDEKIDAENKLSASLGQFKISVEAYPDLKASKNFIQLQDEIADVENKLAAVRRYFNSATKEYNNAVEVFPANVVSGVFGFKREKMFDLAEERATLDKAPNISF